MKGSGFARIEGIVTREANVAVVLRRGPSRATQLLRWDLATDEVTPGQWIRGRVYARRCDLSPDGALLVAAIANYSMAHERQRAARGELDYDSWTAVSRPPYFTALAIWPGAGTYYHGGLWRDGRTLAIDVTPETRLDGPIVPAAVTIERLDLADRSRGGLFDARLARIGWRTLQTIELPHRIPGWRVPRASLETFLASPNWDEATKWAKVAALLNDEANAGRTIRPGLVELAFPGGRLLRTLLAGEDVWTAHDVSDATRITLASSRLDAPLFDVDERGRVIYGERGCLWAWADFPNGEPTMVADLNANVFEPVAPPHWATEWPT